MRTKNPTFILIFLFVLYIYIKVGLIYRYIYIERNPTFIYIYICLRDYAEKFCSSPDHPLPPAGQLAGATRRTQMPLPSMWESTVAVPGWSGWDSPAAV